ncbi:MULTISPECIES: twin-arginine translocation signal domain-containing protein [Natrinema]|uniref:Twin-arginine translocation signal domain-containing protein n=1 Tax=Natrinema gari JCM 14663 TaxID=1230459 RepID=L9YW29_9EURY|nr:MULTISPECIES: twin-arginine translocation signal domain-containing protein [Natrinema]AFO59287.1 hypothetical protein NJ7G_4073 [Natrinema sp. J7-2]ELY77687.1 hypothetical protein C486_14689 [Natrinema gari JCM 14663]
MSENDEGRSRRNVLKTSAATVAAGVGTVAAVGTASASDWGIDVGDQVQAWGDFGYAPGWENSDRSGEWTEINHSWAGYVQAIADDDGTTVYKVDWHKLDNDWWIADRFVREI